MAVASVIVGGSLVAIGASLSPEKLGVAPPKPAAAVTYTVTASPVPTGKRSIPVPCQQSLRWAQESVTATEALGLLYSRNQTIITDTHVAIATHNLAEMNRLAEEQNKLYNEIGPLNDVLAQAQLQYTKVQPACLSDLR